MLGDKHWRDANAQPVSAPPHNYSLPWRVSAYVLVRQNNSVLMVKDKHNHLLTTPGGGVEVEESITAGLQREVQEETGARAKVGQLVCVSEDWFYHTQQQTYHHALLLFYQAQLTAPPTKPADQKIIFHDFVLLSDLNEDNTNPLVMDALQQAGWL